MKKSIQNEPMDSITDVEGNKYKYLQIGSKLWMIENLNVSKFSNGEQIPEIKNNEEWILAAKEGKPAWCYYNNDPDTEQTYGKLYNWYAVKDPRGLSPKDWHIPSDDDWNLLGRNIGGSSNLNNFMNIAFGLLLLGGKRRIGGKTIDKQPWWKSGMIFRNTGDYGSLFLPSGMRKADGEFGELGKLGYWWSTTEFDSNAWVRILFDSIGFIFRADTDKGWGISVKCMKD